MNTYALRLESPVGSQARLFTTTAASADEARERAELAELDLVASSLLPPAKEVWEIGGPAQADLADGDLVVDVGRWDSRHKAFADHIVGLPYEDHVRAAKNRLDEFASRIAIGPDGKVVGSQLSRLAKARYLAHLQTAPYEVVGVEQLSPVEIESAAAAVNGLRELTRLAGGAAPADPRWSPDAWAGIFEQIRQLGFPTAAVTAAIHGLGILTHDDGSAPTVWASNTIAIPLLTAYTANPDTHDYWNDVVGTEIANGNGYTTNGPGLGSKTSTYDTATDQTRLDGADVSLTASTISATDCAIVNRTPATDATRPVLGSVDFGATVSTTAGTFGITWDATGIITRDYT